MYLIRSASSPQVDLVPMNNTRAFIIVNTATAIVQAPVVQGGDNLYHLEFIFVFVFWIATSTFHKNGQALKNGMSFTKEQSLNFVDNSLLKRWQLSSECSVTYFLSN